MKKKRIALILIVIVFIIGLILYLRKSKDYEIEYKVKSANILERYHDRLGAYYYLITYNNNQYEFAFTSEYVSKKLIEDVIVVTIDDTTCIKLKSTKLKTYPVCNVEKSQVSYSSIGKQIDDFYTINTPKEISKKYGKIEIASNTGENILLWNHYGYTGISNSESENIKLFKNEVYADENSFQVGQFIIVPNYDQKYEFDKFYIVDIEKFKVNELNLDSKISFNYYYLGSYDNKGYIFDRKNEKEYLIDPAEAQISIISKENYGKVWNGRWSEVSIVKLKNNDYHFDNSNLFNYVIHNNALYYDLYKGKNRIFIRENIDKIIGSKNEKVFYTYKDKLYISSPYNLDTTVLKYDEIEFNKGLTIYIY